MRKIVSLVDQHRVKDIRIRFQSTVTGLLFGGFWGGVGGAIVFGLLTFFEDTGASRDWILLFTIIGSIWGLFFGGILGAIIGFRHANTLTSIITGAALGLLIAIRLGFDGIDIFLFVVIPLFAILGWIISSTLQAWVSRDERTY